MKESPADVGQLPDGASDASLAAAAAAPPVKKPVFRTTEEWTLAEMLRFPALWFILVAVLGLGSSHYLFLAHAAMHLRDLGHSSAQVAAAFSVLALARLLGMLLVAVLGHRIEPRLIMAVSILALGVGMVIGLKAAGPVTIYLSTGVIGLGIGGALPCMGVVCANYFGKRNFVSVIGLCSVVACTAGAGASYGAGLVFDHFGSYSLAFYSCSILCLVGFVSLLLMKAPVRKTPATHGHDHGG